MGPARPASYGAGGGRRGPFFFEDNDYVRGTVPRINTLATALRARGGTVAWVVPTSRELPPRDVEFFGADIAAMFNASGGKGPVRARLWPELEPADDDVYAEKTAFSAFFAGASDLHEQLQARGIENLVVAGTVTNVCVEGTVRDAAGLGYRVVLVADACAARRDQDHNATLHVVYRTFGDVRPTSEVLELF
ncbi:cysteine hydrolase family protein [Nocardioides anomalus]|uniref:cysteine hydrolase family protein n=1 Tax=Nocardioides anomalus TaxID=2712223 RepID=UPI001E510E26|nr:isochorismatase family cysteine hydrolase [Nocardioides anomalus]